MNYPWLSSDYHWTAILKWRYPNGLFEPETWNRLWIPHAHKIFKTAFEQIYSNLPTLDHFSFPALSMLILKSSYVQEFLNTDFYTVYFLSLQYNLYYINLLQFYLHFVTKSCSKLLKNRPIPGITVS